jgi:hypothetical protein
MGMSMRSWAGEDFLKPEDLRRGPRKEQIALVQPPNDNDKFPKPRIVCESGKIIKLSPTSVGNLMREFGDDSDGWVGKFIECRVKDGLIDNKQTEWIEVEALEAITPNQRRKIEPPKSGGGPNDEIPF